MVAEIADTFRLLIVRLMTQTDSLLSLIYTNLPLLHLPHIEK